MTPSKGLEAGGVAFLGDTAGLVGEAAGVEGVADRGGHFHRVFGVGDAGVQQEQRRGTPPIFPFPPGAMRDGNPVTNEFTFSAPDIKLRHTAVGFPLPPPAAHPLPSVPTLSSRQLASTVWAAAGISHLDGVSGGRWFPGRRVVLPARPCRSGRAIVSRPAPDHYNTWLLWKPPRDEFIFPRAQGQCGWE